MKTKQWFIMIALLSGMNSCGIQEDALQTVLEKCGNMGIDKLRTQNTISEPCRSALQDVLPQREDNSANSFMPLGSGKIDQKQILFLAGTDSNSLPILITSPSQLQIQSYNRGQAQIIDTAFYRLKKIIDYPSTIVSISCIMDYSGSMSAQDIRDAGGIYSDLFDALSLVSHFEANIIFFSDSSTIISDFSSDADFLKTKMLPNTTIKRNSTALFDAMGLGISLLSSRTSPIKLLFAATDGMENSSFIVTSKEQLYSRAKTGRISFVLLGSLLSDVVFLSEAAKKTGGYFLYNKALINLRNDFSAVKNVITNTISIELASSAAAADSFRVMYKTKYATFIP